MEEAKLFKTQDTNTSMQKGKMFQSPATEPTMDAITMHHLNNLKNGTYVPNEDGSISTVRTIQVDFDGIPTLIPTVWDGKIVDSTEEAVMRARKSGIKWPQAKTHQELRNFDIKIHEPFASDIEKYIKNKGK